MKIAVISDSHYDTSSVNAVKKYLHDVDIIIHCGDGAPDIKLLEEAGADALDADNGSYDAWYWAHPPMYMPLACNLDDAKFIKKHVNIPVATVGRITEAWIADEMIANEYADACMIGRANLCDPEFTNKSFSIKESETGS